LKDSAMSVSIIPAHPGFFAVRRVGGTVLHLPVIAWQVEQLGEILTRVEVSAIGLDGLFDPECPIYGPNGVPAHE
jgi:hypothetical protein